MQFSLLLHGPYANQWLDRIGFEIEQSRISFSHIVLVCYIKDYTLFYSTCNNFLKKYSVVLVPIKDTINPGFFNINRQIRSVQAGLKHIPTNTYVFKLRVDQSINFKKVLSYISNNKIVTTNCFTRRDRLYHPSDMFLSAHYNIIKSYYNLNNITKTHIMSQIYNIEQSKKNHSIKSLMFSPESILFRNFLISEGWDLKDTIEDSLNALQTYFTLANSWNIDFRWHPKRTYAFPQDSLILPHSFAISPFPGFPVEYVRCYDESHINGTHLTLKDIFYLLLSKIIWGTYSVNIATSSENISIKRRVYLFIKSIIQNISPRLYNFIKSKYKYGK